MVASSSAKSWLAFAFAPDNNLLAAVNKSKIQLWDLRTGKKELASHQPPAGKILDMTCFDVNRIVVLTEDNNTASVWEMPAGKKLYSFAGPAEYWPQGQSATLDALTALGFRVNPHRGRVNSVDEMMKFIDDAEKQRATLGYEIDGVVLKVDAHADAAAAGLHGPRAALGHRVQVHRAGRRSRSLKTS